MAEQIRIIEEDESQGRVGQIYSDIKRTMGVPVVGDLFRAFAAFPPFLELVWWEVKPLFGSLIFEGLADRIRAHALACARQHCFVPDHTAALAAAGMPKYEIDHLRGTVELFFHVDPRLLVISTAVRESLATGQVGSAKRMPIERRAPISLALPSAVKLASSARLPAKASLVLSEVRTALGVPFVPSDYRAFATWQNYLPMAWADVKGQVRTAQYRQDVKGIADIALAGVSDLPRLVRVDDTSVRSAGVSEGQLSQISAIVETFYRLMPSLVGTVALLRLGLNSMLEHQLLEREAGA
ncbi:MAG: halocarboxylic acid dehydrogenase DehI family protein [Chloroflexi bacterium]|nr:halocarboxylic acid dehydrogenase DehI family protein [Chloroflexota bacterium]